MTNVSSLPNENVKLPWQENFCSARHCDFGSFCSGVCFTTRVLEKLASQCCGEACLTLAVLQIVLQKLPRACCAAFFSGKAYVREGLFHTRHFVWFDMKRFGKINCLINGLNTYDIDR